MGADGGLSFVKCKEPSLINRAYTLIKILGLIDSNFRDESYEYLDKCDWFNSDQYLITAYGTDIDHDGFNDLRNLLAANEKEFKLDHRTIEEVIQDVATRPYWQLFELTDCSLDGILCRAYSNHIYQSFRYRGKNAEYWIHKLETNPFALADKILKDFSTYRKYYEQDINLSELKVCDWFNEIDRLIDWKHCWSEETWT